MSDAALLPQIIVDAKDDSKPLRWPPCSFSVIVVLCTVPRSVGKIVSTTAGVPEDVIRAHILSAILGSLQETATLSKERHGAVERIDFLIAFTLSLRSD